MKVDRILITDLPFWRLASLAFHSRKRIRKKYARTLFVQRTAVADRDDFIAHLRFFHQNGFRFTSKGERSAARALRKAGHHDVRTLHR